MDGFRGVYGWLGQVDTHNYFQLNFWYFTIYRSSCTK